MTELDAATGGDALAQPESERQPSALGAVGRYWSSLKAPRARLPRRSDFDPRPLRDHISGAFILHRPNTGMTTIRVAGRDISALAGMDARTLPLASLFAPAQRIAIEDLLDRAFLDPAILKLTPRLVEEGKTARQVSLAIWPMLGNDGVVSSALGYIDFCEAAPAPARLSLTGEEPEFTAIGLRSVASSPAIRPNKKAGINTPTLKLVVNNDVKTAD